MSKLVGIALAVAGLIATASVCQAHGLGRRGCEEKNCGVPTCVTPCAPQWVEKSVTCYRPEWKEREVTCTVNRVVPHDVVTHEKCTVMVPTWHEEKKMVTMCKRVPREVEREIVTCRKVRVCEPPCEDCCAACRRRPRHHREWVQEVCKVKCLVWDSIPETREVTVRVCQYVPQERSYDVHRIVCETRPETIVKKERYCVMVPYQVKVKVPTCCQ
jgi:hypothetical protein